MHHIWKKFAGAGAAAAAALALSLLAAPVSADTTAEIVIAPPVATATTQPDDTQHSGWETVDGKRYYYDPETGEMQTGWLVLTNGSISRRYFFGEDGAVMTGFFRTDTNTSPVYYADEEGAVVKGGIHTIDGKPYWFYEDGSLHTGWQTVNGKRYFYDPVTGEITFGWIIWNGGYYYVTEKDGKYTSLQEVDGEYYPFDKENGAIAEGLTELPNGITRYYYGDGAYHTGWFYQNGKTYYFNDVDGAMFTGWQTIDDQTYYFQEDGAAKVGWLELSGKRYYIDKEAKLCTGWQTINGKRYCFRADGSAVTGWQTDASGSSYYFLDDGTMATGWTSVGKNTYYFRKDGVLMRGVTEIDGKQYLLAEDTGILQKNTTINGITTDANGVIIKRILSVPYLSQSGFPTGCESASAVMLLRQAGYSTSIADFVDKYLDKGSFYWKNGTQYGPDPSTKFVGDPRSSSGFGCYAPVITNALNKILTNGKTAKNITGTSFSSLLTQYIDKGIPVAVWASINMMQIDNGRQWVVPETGKLFTWKRHEHCLVLVGYDKDYYYMNDPYQSKGLVAYKRSVVEARYATMGSQAVVIQ